MVLEVSPGLSVVLVILDETGIVESSIVNLEDVLLALAPLEAIGHLEEGQVLLVGAIGYAGSITAEVLDGVLLHEDSKFSVKFLLLFDVGLEGRCNGLDESLSE